MLIFHLQHAQTILKLPSLSVEFSVVKHVIETSQKLEIVFMTSCLEHRILFNS